MQLDAGQRLSYFIQPSMDFLSQSGRLLTDRQRLNSFETEEMLDNRLS